VKEKVRTKYRRGKRNFMLLVLNNVAEPELDPKGSWILLVVPEPL
jgi:hypothetical protein